jgi:hypothetical protein
MVVLMVYRPCYVACGKEESNKMMHRYQKENQTSLPTTVQPSPLVNDSLTTPAPRPTLAPSSKPTFISTFYPTSTSYPTITFSPTYEESFEFCGENSIVEFPNNTVILLELVYSCQQLVQDCGRGLLDPTLCRESQVEFETSCGCTRNEQVNPSPTMAPQFPNVPSSNVTDPPSPSPLNQERSGGLAMQSNTDFWFLSSFVLALFVFY